MTAMSGSTPLAMEGHLQKMGKKTEIVASRRLSQAEEKIGCVLGAFSLRVVVVTIF